MLAVLRKKSQASALKMVVASLALLALLFFLLNLIIDITGIFTGGQDILDLDLNDDLRNTWVFTEVDVPLGIFASEEQGAATWNYWLVPTIDGERALALRVGQGTAKHIDNKLTDMMVGFFYNGELQEPYVLYGNLVPITGKVKTFFEQEMADWGLDSSLALPYYIDVNSADGLHLYFIFALFGGIALLFILHLIRFIRATCGAYQKPLRTWAASGGDETAALNRLDEWPTTALQPVSTKNIWLGPDLLITQKRTKTVVYDLADVVWAYKQVLNTPGAAPACSLVLNFRDKSSKHIPMLSVAADQSLRFLMQNAPHIVIGHTADRDYLFQHDPSQMRSTQNDPSADAG